MCHTFTKNAQVVAVIWTEIKFWTLPVKQNKVLFCFSRKLEADQPSIHGSAETFDGQLDIAPANAELPCSFCGQIFSDISSLQNHTVIEHAVGSVRLNWTIYRESLNELIRFNLAN